MQSMLISFTGKCGKFSVNTCSVYSTATLLGFELAGWSKMRNAKVQKMTIAKYFSHFIRCHFRTFSFRTFAFLKNENAKMLTSNLRNKCENL